MCLGGPGAGTQVIIIVIVIIPSPTYLARDTVQPGGGVLLKLGVQRVAHRALHVLGDVLAQQVLNMLGSEPATEDEAVVAIEGPGGACRDWGG